MTEKTEPLPVIDFATRRKERLHLVHEARLEKMRGEFEKAFPLPGKPATKLTRPTKKKKKPRKP
ncbi:hypothetical protein [Halopseudomonas salina]|uniref:Uncharacterized protein n=1 Tax=Halopseudomonas salina TaxID=1323744 RepID=A0ABQ1NXQ0_9GAMM|nr:hypothetical protein [Halopseudomonas salina]GGC86934.1 hypothetical protein GCM10007418_03410 [Halopseudomonas salina]